jgi:hypothetical protein
MTGITSSVTAIFFSSDGKNFSVMDVDLSFFPVNLFSIVAIKEDLRSCYEK